MPSWFAYPAGLTFEEQAAWRAAVREVADLVADQAALAWANRLDETWDLFDRAGLIVGSRNHMMMSPEEKAALYDELDQVLGVV
jgi:GAF domain-containing protein